MKTFNLLFNSIAICVLLLTGAATGCRRCGCEVLEDTRTAGRHFNRGVGSLGGKHGDSRAVASREDFYPYYDSYVTPDYIPLPDQNPCDISMGEFVAPQPREIPGDPGSSIPGIDAFKDPATCPELAGVFRMVHFEYNNYLVKGNENMDIVHDVARYMSSHPHTYIFVEGHCDERGPEAYNLALGARRSDSVRNLLINGGVDPDRIFTISYGKERPLVLEHHEEAWGQNRRAEFKVYQRS
jgi:peptidoglycan-associated lipoprotein